MFPRAVPLCALLLCAIAGQAPAQVIDFETLPDSSPTVDQQSISTEYAIYGVSFALLSRTTGEPIGFPRIAKAGAPLTAFEGCFSPDTPRPHLDLGTSLLTDDTGLGVSGDLQITYATPVAQASGIVLDIDCRVNGGAPCEQWTVTAYDTLGVELDSVVLDGPPGPPETECLNPDAGPGDSEAFGWVIDSGTPQIASIVLSYTGAASNVGLAFDHFSVAGAPGPPSVTAASEVDTVCAYEPSLLTATVSEGLPPFSFQWQRETTPNTWIDLGTDFTQKVVPVATTRYRVIVTDGTAAEATSTPVTVVVSDTDPFCTAPLLVSSNANDRVIRYGYGGRPWVFVETGAGGLNGPSKLVCGADGNLYVVSQNNDRVLRYDGATGEFIDIFVAAGDGGLDIPVGLDFGPDGDLYVASYITHSVIRYDGNDGSLIDTFIPTGSGLNGPTGLVFGPDGNLYVSSILGHKVLHFDGSTGAPLGDFVTAGSGGLNRPRGLVFGPDGNLYVAEESHDSVSRYDGTTGAFIDIFVPAGSDGLDRANDVAFGPGGHLYVPSYNNDQLLRYDSASGAPVGAMPNDFIDGPAWATVGCLSAVSAVPDRDTPSLGLLVEPSVPNPFNPRTTVAFTLVAGGRTRVSVVDLKGRIVATVLDRDLSAGRHTVEWDGRFADGRAAPSGAYLMRVENGRAVEAAKMLLLR